MRGGCDVGLERQLVDVSKVITDGASRGWHLHGYISPQEFAVAESGST